VATDRTIWLSRASGRIFLVPDDVALPTGEFVLHNLLGEEREVDAEQVAAFECTPAQAEAHLTERIERFLAAIPGEASADGTEASLPKAGEAWVGPSFSSQLTALFNRLSEEAVAKARLAPPEDVGNGLRFTHVMATETKRRVSELSATLSALLEALVERGVLGRTELERHLEEAAAAERARVASEALVVLSDVPDKYALSNLPEIDCEARIPLCHARCCSLLFALSTQDLDERVVRWEYGRPYQIARREDGVCVHNERESRRCAIYEKRPAHCRGYDCRRDRRIWIDFERRIPA
jgi:hypothetical protein